MFGPPGTGGLVDTSGDYGSAGNREGTWINSSDNDYYGTYVSSSGRTYIEWTQASGTTWGGLPMFTKGKTMASVGCNVYGMTILLNSVGIDVNPGDVHSIYKTFGSENEVGTMNKILRILWCIRFNC